jgi:prepilin signal peptidase PulO-like enzyme (type II secretory pathway)
MNAFTIALTNLLFIGLEVMVAVLLYFLYNRFPLSWFLEHDSNSDMVSGAGSDDFISPRLKKFPDSIVFCSGFVVVNFIFYLQHGFSLLFFCNLLSVIFLFYIAVSDLKTRIIPDQFISGLIFISLFWILYDMSTIYVSEAMWYEMIFSRLLGALAGGGVILLIGFVGSKLFKQEAMGMGDVKLMFACGLIIGINAIFAVLALSFMLAFIPALIQIRNSRHGRSGAVKMDSQMPFGPFIAMATILFLVFPSEFLSLIDWWLKIG